MGHKLLWSLVALAHVSKDCLDMGSEGRKGDVSLLHPKWELLEGLCFVTPGTAPAFGDHVLVFTSCVPLYVDKTLNLSFLVHSLQNTHFFVSSVFHTQNNLRNMGLVGLLIHPLPPAQLTR